MKTAFVWTPAMTQDVPVIPHDATEWHQSLPRVTRKALRVTQTHKISKANNKANSRTNHSADTIVSDWLSIHDPLNDAEYLALNTCDCDAYLNEFQDDYGMDDLAAHCTQNGLTVVAPGRDTRRWLKGYNIL